jgi:hypothetical protein
MSASENRSKDQCLVKIIRLLDASFGEQNDPDILVTAVRKSVSNLKNSLAYVKSVEEVAQLVLKDESAESIKKLLKLVYLGTDPKNLQKAIHFVQIFDRCNQSLAYKALYEEIKLKKQTTEPEMLLLLKKINQMVHPDVTVLDETKKQLDKDCSNIISRIVKGIEEKDYSISCYATEKLDSNILDDYIHTIVNSFATNLSGTLLLIQFSQTLPYTSKHFLLSDDLLGELENNQLLESEQSMHLWAYAKWMKRYFYPVIGESRSYDNICAKLSVNKDKLLQHYQNYVEDPNKLKIKYLHERNPYLESITSEFVTFYYNGDLGRTQNLLAAANAIDGHVHFNRPLVGVGRRMVRTLHHEMIKSDHLNSFGAFRLFHMFQHHHSFMNKINFRMLGLLEENAPAWMRQLLWPERATEFLVINKFFNATLSVQEYSNRVVCFALADKRSNQTWKITVGPRTLSLLTLTHFKTDQKLGVRNETSSPCLGLSGEEWMVKAVDEHHLKIYRSFQGRFLKASRRKVQIKILQIMF